ncbi:unnamed protein product [Cuscuta epithymum]|uniref:GRF-type domain-containing protein n=1 Tax=Cuscuta epithymum TaxID=186058 RepID=A0AAV0E2P5_9ASTE|nr:unnamed protein product [Cuscuta epithymum]
MGAEIEAGFSFFRQPVLGVAKGRPYLCSRQPCSEVSSCVEQEPLCPGEFRLECTTPTGCNLFSSIQIESKTFSFSVEFHYPCQPRYCKCRMRNGMPVKASLWTSWTDKNQGRRFYGCPNYESDSCGFFEWHDEPLTGRAKVVINELKLENKQLRLRFGNWSMT